MSAASYSAGDYPIRLNKRESKVVETATSVSATALAAADVTVAATAESNRTSFVKATTADATTDFDGLAIGDLVVHILVDNGTTVALAAAVADTNPHGNAIVNDFYIIIKAKA